MRVIWIVLLFLLLEAIVVIPIQHTFGDKVLNGSAGRRLSVDTAMPHICRCSTIQHSLFA